MGRYTYIWEFQVRADRVADFLKHYDSAGSWVALFRRADGYIGTHLLRDHNDPLRFVTVDDWESPEHYRAFREQFAAEYAALDQVCEALTVQETARGEILDRAADVARWRKMERERQLAARMALPPDVRAAQTAAIADGLNQIVSTAPGTIISGYWPIKAEPDLRPWMQEMWERGARVTLPVAIAVGQALAFREWRPGARMTRGLWNIPHPADGAELAPTIALAPLLGFDDDCFRLGYGGGFFDRTLAALDPRPLAIGVGYATGNLRTIYPQPHDIPMDWIVTGTAPPVRRPGFRHAP